MQDLLLAVMKKSINRRDFLSLGSERIELYDLKNDPEELNDLATSKPATTVELGNELKQKLAQVNEPYQWRSLCDEVCFFSIHQIVGGFLCAYTHLRYNFPVLWEFLLF